MVKNTIEVALHRVLNFGMTRQKKHDRDKDVGISFMSREHEEKDLAEDFSISQYGACLDL